jgi:hypothetical protein
MKAHTAQSHWFSRTDLESARTLPWEYLFTVSPKLIGARRLAGTGCVFDDGFHLSSFELKCLAILALLRTTPSGSLLRGIDVTTLLKSNCDGVGSVQSARVE